MLTKSIPENAVFLQVMLVSEGPCIIHKVSSVSRLKLSREPVDNTSMEASQLTMFMFFRRGKKNFTLPEVLSTIIIMGIIFSIASSSWFEVVESRRVTAATNQLAADMRLAHSKSVNGLASWRVVLVPGVGPEADGPDYYLVKITSGASPIVDTGIPSIKSTLPGDTSVNGGFDDDAVVRVPYSVPALGIASGRATRSVEFDADGSVDNYSGAGVGRDTIMVTQDGLLNVTVQFNEQTSRIRVG